MAVLVNGILSPGADAEHSQAKKWRTVAVMFFTLLLQLISTWTYYVREKAPSEDKGWPEKVGNI